MKNFSSKTKGNYLLNSKEKKPTKKYFVWIIVAFIVLFLGKGIVGSVSSVVTTPLFYVRHYLTVSTSAIPVYLRSHSDLLKQIQSLHEELAAEKGKEESFRIALLENEELRNLLSASSAPQIAAGVISRPPNTPYDTMIIDRGTADGIVEFAPVYYGNKMALGYVRQVYAHSALVALFSSPGVESTVYVFGPNLFTKAYGEGSGVVRISVPHGVTVEKGNMIILPSIDTGVLGTIDSVQSIPTEPEQRAYVTYDQSLQSIRIVSVGTEPLIPVTFEEAEAEVREREQALFNFSVPPGARMEFSTTSTSTLLETGSSTLLNTPSI